MSLLLDALKQAAKEMRESNETIQNLAGGDASKNQLSREHSAESAQAEETIDLNLDLDIESTEKNHQDMKKALQALGKNLQDEYQELNNDFESLEQALEERHGKIIEKFREDKLDDYNYLDDDQAPGLNSETDQNAFDLELDDELEYLLNDESPEESDQQYHTAEYHDSNSDLSDQNIPTLSDNLSPHSYQPKKLSPNDLSSDMLEPNHQHHPQSSVENNTAGQRTLTEEEIEEMVNGAFSASESNQKVNDIKDSIIKAKKNEHANKESVKTEQITENHNQNLEHLIASSEKIKKSQQSRKIAIVFFLILLTLLLGVGYFYYINFLLPKPKFDYSTLPVNPIVEDFLEEEIVIETENDLSNLANEEQTEQELIEEQAYIDLVSGAFDNKTKTETETPVEKIFVEPEPKPINPPLEKAKKNENIATQPPPKKIKQEPKPPAVKKLVQQPVKIDLRDPVEVKLEQAFIAFHQDQYMVARKLYHEVLDIEPENRDALLGMGAIDTKLGNFDSAINHYQQLLITNPTDDVAQAGLLQISLQLDSTHLETQLKIYIGKNPKSAFLRFVLGSVYANRKQWKQAQQQFMEAISLEPRNPDFNYNLAVSYDQLGTYSQALSFYQQAMSLSWGRSINFSKELVHKRIENLKALAQDQGWGQ